MSKEFKPYAVIAFVKPKDKADPNGTISKYKGRSYKGITFATSMDKAKEKTFDVIIEAFKDSKANVNREVITIKSCKLHNDFIVPPETNSNE